MANYKKMDDHDFVFVNKPLTAKEEKAISDFLRSRKLKTKAWQNPKAQSRPKTELV